MITVIIRDNGEPRVIQLTYENIWKELKDIPGAELVVATDWFDAVKNVKNKFVCLVEADCLVSSGYFNSLAGHMRKNPQLGKLGILSTATAVNNWAVKFFGYSLGDGYSQGVIPNKEKKATSLGFYTLQVAYIPGSIIRTHMLQDMLEMLEANSSWQEDLVFMSTMLSIGFWRKNWMINIAPNSTYCTTEEYVNDIGKFETQTVDLAKKFVKESI